MHDPSATGGRGVLGIAARMPWYGPECTTRLLWRVRVRVRVIGRGAEGGRASAEIEFIRIA